MVDNDSVYLNGNIPTLLTEMSLACKTLKESLIKAGMSEEEAKEQLQRGLDYAFKSQGERVAEAIKAINEKLLRR